MWFTKDVKKICLEELKLNLSDETIKQLNSYIETAPMADVMGGRAFYDIHWLCRITEDHDRAVRTWLSYREKLTTLEIYAFLEKAEKIGLTGKPFMEQLVLYSVHKDVYEITKPPERDWSKLVKTVVSENADTIASMDKSKAENWLVGQVMKRIEDRKNVDPAKIKEEILKCTGT